jgi:hypothetical protein
MDVKKVDGVFDAIEKQITHLEEMLELQDRKIELLESINDTREETIYYLKRVIVRILTEEVDEDEKARILELASK